MRFFAALAGCLLPVLQAQSVMPELYSLPPDIETRWATAENPRGERGAGGQTNSGRKGRPAVTLPAGGQHVLAEVNGRSGTVRRIWLTFLDRSPVTLRSLRFEIYWDGATKPAVSAPLGDFFGVSLGRIVAFESALFASPEGRSFNCFIPMPFRTGMRIVVINDGQTPVPSLYYEVNYTLGDRHDASVLYFHAAFRRERQTKLQQDFEILPLVRGKGRFLGANLGVIADQKRYEKSWWGEGEVKIFVDGDRDNPTLVGTGTEDYVGTGFSQGKFDHFYQGSPIADRDAMRFSFYRYHVPDPVYFRDGIRVTIQQIGFVNGKQVLLENPERPIFRAGHQDALRSTALC